MKRYQIKINLNGENVNKFYKLVDLPYNDQKITPAMLSQMFLKRKCLSSLTTMPRTFRVYGETCPSYEQWLCDKLNKNVTRVIYYPGKHSILDLEEHVRGIQKNDTRPLKNIYEIYKENCLEALAFVKRQYGVGSIQQWLDKNLGQLQDRHFSECSITLLNKRTNNTVISLAVNTNDDLSLWYSNVKDFFVNEQIDCSTTYKVLDYQEAVANKKV